MPNETEAARAVSVSDMALNGSDWRLCAAYRRLACACHCVGKALIDNVEANMSGERCQVAARSALHPI